QASSQALAIRLVLAFIDMHESGNTDRMQLDAVLADIADAGGVERMAEVTMALVSRVIEQAVDPDMLRESLRSELARLAEDDTDV
ncbi:hypothetical protein, partial [Williamsia muralis]